MQSKRANSPNPNHPALIPIAGNYDRKPRSIEREVTTIGRARGCDLCLEANEISTLHCILYRTTEGYRLRDCNSRTGTRINGEPTKNALLRNTDIINIGSFSFEFSLPTVLFPNDGNKLDPVKVEHWKNSRRHFAEISLKLRQRLRSGPCGGSLSEQEYKQKANLLKDKIRCYDQRLNELDAAETELTEERRQLDLDKEKQRQHVQNVEKQLAERLAQADREIRDQWQEFQQRCQAEEARQHHVGPTWATVSDDATIQQQQDRLRDLDIQLATRAEQLQREKEEFSTMKDQWVNGQATATATLEEQQSALAQKKAELMRMMGDLKKMQEDIRKQARPDIRALHDEIERLTHANRELRACVEENEALKAQLDHLHDRSAASELSTSERELLLAEIALLRQEAELREQSGDADSSRALREENEQLRQLLDEQARQIDEITSAEPKTPKTENDLERYESELNEFRRQLETDRNKLNKEVEILRERNKELDEAVREMEMEMSKERAELARERIRLERVREEVKADSERLQREMAVRDSMAPVQKLRDELSGRPAKNDKALNDRLRSVRNQLTDSSPAGS